jgi:hypothetical protein
MKKYGFILVITTLFFASVNLIAQVPGEPGSVGDAFTMLPTILALFKSGKSLMAAAGIVLILVYLIRQYVLPKLNLSTKALPLVAALLGLVTGPLVAIWLGGSAQEALLAALSGPVASTIWQALLKYFMPDAPPATQA